MNLIPFLNKALPRAHMGLELDVLDVYGKLVKYLIEKKKLKKNKFLHTAAIESQGISGVKNHDNYALLL